MCVLRDGARSGLTETAGQTASANGRLSMNTVNRDHPWRQCMTCLRLVRQSLLCLKRAYSADESLALD